VASRAFNSAGCHFQSGLASKTILSRDLPADSMQSALAIAYMLASKDGRHLRRFCPLSPQPEISQASTQIRCLRDVVFHTTKDPVKGLTERAITALASFRRRRKNRVLPMRSLDDCTIIACVVDAGLCSAWRRFFGRSLAAPTRRGKLAISLELLDAGIKDGTMRQRGTANSSLTRRRARAAAQIANGEGLRAGVVTTQTSGAQDRDNVAVRLS
jgi:hypothetical protein